MRTVIIHGKKWTKDGDYTSPKAGRPECALWTVTRAICRFWQGKLTDWDEHYDIHPLTKSGRFEGIPVRRPDAWDWYRAQDGTRPIYLQAPEHHHPDNHATALDLFNQVPGARRFPIREIQRAAPINGEPNRWFVEMTGMLIAKAVLLDGFEHIILNGVGCMRSLEFQVAHRSILYWMAFARGRGVQVDVEGPSIYHTPAQIYAYEKFNYDEYAAAKHEDQHRHEWIAQDDVNRKEQARGRPVRYRIPPMDQDAV
jgi:hypothetical protein